MPRPSTTKTIPFSVFERPRPAPSPPSHNQAQFPVSKFARSEGSLLKSHGLSLDNGGGFTYDSNALFRPLKGQSNNGGPEWGEYIGLQRGRLRSWVWSWARKKWITFQGNYLCASHSKEDTEYTDTLPLNQIHDLYAVESRRFCCAVCGPVDTWYLIFNDAIMFQTWMNEIQRRCPLLNISSPTAIKHLLHVEHDFDAGLIKGLPKPWIQKIGLSSTDYEEPAATPMSEPLRSPVHSASSHSASSTSSSSQQQRQRYQRHQRHQLQIQRRQEEITSCSMPTPTPMPAARTTHQRDSSYVRLNRSTSSASASNPPHKSEFGSGSSPALIKTGSTHRHHHKPDIPSSLLPIQTTSTLIPPCTSNGRAQLSGHSPSENSPIYCPDLETRDLTGLVKTVHLFPTAQRDFYDTWKGNWTGKFGTRQVAIHVLRFISDSDNRITAADQRPPSKDRKLIQRLSTIILHELTALHQLRHPNVVRIRGFTTDLFLTGDTGGLPALVSTWITGPNIMEYLKETIPVVNAKRRVKWLAEAASGLSYIHSFPYQILHGSFRGCQIQLQVNSQAEPVAIITGFGLNPLLADEDAKWSLPNAKPSPRWASPEVIFGQRKEISDMADVFSFGRCVVEVLTSQQPYPHIDSDEDVLSLIISSASTSNGVESVYYPKPRLKSREDNSQNQQQRHHPSAYQTKSAHEQESIRTLLRLWPLLKRCWLVCSTNRPSMEKVRKELVDGIVNEIEE